MNTVNRFFKTPVNHRNVLESQIFLGGGANSNLDFSDKKNKNHGFSLIEMIVVVAILAVMVLVLAPKLLSYNERSRAEKDNSSMDEVVNAIQLALADQEIYDEVLRFSTVNNVSCYVDTNSEANYSKIVTKENPSGINQYTFTSDARTLDETPYFAAGNMRGVTITFAPDKGSNGSTYDLKQGVVNQYVQVSGNQRVGAMPKLYNRLRSSVGDVISNNSQTYRNSEFTIFIAIGSTGGKDASAQDAVRTYGQWSGTNLPVQVSYQIVSDRTVGDTGNTIVDIDDNKWNQTNGNKITVSPGDLNGGGSYTPGTQTGNSKLDEDEDSVIDETKDEYDHNTPELHPIGTLPDGAYYANLRTGVIYTEMPDNVSLGDAYLYGDYLYFYEYETNYWSVSLATIDLGLYAYLPEYEWVDRNQSSYDPILESINGINVGSVNRTFEDCIMLLEAPVIPQFVVDMEYAFYRCGSLKSLPQLPMGLVNLYGTFSDCESIADAANIKVPDSVIHMGHTFSGCTSMKSAPKISKNVVEMEGCFRECASLQIGPDISESTKLTDISAIFMDCASLKSASAIPSNVIDMQMAFYGCKSLVLAPDMSGAVNVTNMDQSFGGCVSLISPPDLRNLNKLQKMNSTFAECEKMQIAPVIPNSAIEIDFLFSKCRSLKIAPVIPNGITDIQGLFYECESLIVAPVIPEGVVDMWNTFRNCKLLTQAPAIPNSVLDFRLTFSGCTSLTGTIEINANPIQGNVGYYGDCFSGVDMSRITITGSSTMKKFIANTGDNSDYVTIIN